MFKKKNSTFILICIFLLIFFMCIFILHINSGLPKNPSKEELADFFNENFEVFNQIIIYFESLDGDVTIDKYEIKDIKYMAKLLNSNGLKNFVITDDETKNNITNLFYKNGFQYIYEEVNCVFFVKSSGFQWHKSIVYSKDGKTTWFNRMRDFKDLGNGWYYYYGE